MCRRTVEAGKGLLSHTKRSCGGVSSRTSREQGESPTGRCDIANSGASDSIAVWANTVTDIARVTQSVTL